MTADTKPSGPCPTFFRAACREASRGGASQSYEHAGYTLAGAVAGLVEYRDDDDRAAKLKTLDDLFRPPGPGGLVRLKTLDDLFRPPGPGGLVRSFAAFSSSPDSAAVVDWFRRELPRCLDMVPARRHVAFLRGVFRYVIEEGNGVGVW